VIQQLDPRDSKSDNVMGTSTSFSESKSEPAIVLGSEFEDEDQLYCVISIDCVASLVTAECKYPTGGGNMTFLLVHVVESIKNRLE
jgi:hypothetical protein